MAACNQKEVVMSPKGKSLAVRLAVKIENALMPRLVPANHPGPLFKRLFKIPFFLYAIGMPLFNDFILLLTTTGRKSGKLCQTPLPLQPGIGANLRGAGLSIGRAQPYH